MRLWNARGGGSALREAGWCLLGDRGSRGVWALPPCTPHTPRQPSAQQQPGGRTEATGRQQLVALGGRCLTRVRTRSSASRTTAPPLDALHCLPLQAGCRALGEGFQELGLRLQSQVCW